MNITEIKNSIVKNSKVWTMPLRNAFSESKGVQLLSAVLVLQLAVAGGLLWRSNLQGNFVPAVQLVSVDPSTVDEIVIDDGEAQVLLKNTGDYWHMNDEYETLATTDKINQLISDINELNPGLPVAGTAGSHRQLEVSDTDFQRRVTMKTDGEVVADLYMGTSPGFRKSHIRLVGQDQVYAARLNTFDLPANQDDWLDKSILAFDDDINGITLDSIELSRAGENWTIVSPHEQTESHQVDVAGITSLVSRLKSLRVNGFASLHESDEPSDTVPIGDETIEPSEADVLATHSITVVQNDTPITLMISKKGSNATIERSDVKGSFAVPIATYDSLSGDVIQQLLVEKNSDAAVEVDQPQG